MKRKMKTAVSLLLTLTLTLCLLSGCGTEQKNESPIGKWYNSSGKCLDIRSDNTWKLEDSYGTGTWKLLDDGVTFEFTDYYGDTYESTIIKGDLGKYIDFGHYGNFYKNAYPNIDNINQDDIFADVKLKVLGASPLCKVSVDTTDCSDYIKENITYSVDTKYYSSGEKVTVYANMTGDTSKKNVKSKEFTVKSNYQYISSADEIDTKALNDMIEDYLKTEKSKYSKEESEFYKYLHRNVEIVSTTISESGFFKLDEAEIESVKTNVTEKVYYNAYYCIYVIEVLNHNNNKTYNYVSEVFLQNVCKKSNGELTWNIMGVDKEECDNITGRCYSYKSNFSKASYYAYYYKNEKYKLNALYTNNNIDYNAVN